MDTVRIYQCDEFSFSSTGRLGVEIGSCWRAGFSNLAKKIKWVLETLGYALSSGNVPRYLNYLKYLKILLSSGFWKLLDMFLLRVMFPST